MTEKEYAELKKMKIITADPDPSRPSYVIVEGKFSHYQYAPNLAKAVREFDRADALNATKDNQDERTSTRT